MARPPEVRHLAAPALVGSDAHASGLALRWLICGEAEPGALSVPEQLAARIGSLVVQGRFPPGARLPEADLSAAFGVSRAPVREALRILEREGLVRILARRGAHVTRLSVRELEDLFDIRAALFGRLVAAVARTRTGPAMAEIETGLGEMEAVAGRTAEAYALAGFRLTMVLARTCPNERLRDMVVSLALQTLRYSTLGFDAPARRRESLAIWRQLVAAIRRGDAPAAQDHVETLISRSAAAAVEQLTRKEQDDIAEPVGRAASPA